MQVKALPGFRDFYPEVMAVRTRITDAWRTVARRYGFEEYDGPPLEALELYTAKSGSEIVEQLYTFTDRGGRQVALRPEMTPTLARMVAARIRALRKPVRWFSMPQLFRYERQQRGRLREHFQLNMDLIGSSAPLADAEVMAAAIDVVRELGFRADAFRCRVSDRNVASAMVQRRCGVNADAVPLAFQAIDKVARSAVEARRIAETSFAEDPDVCRSLCSLIDVLADPAEAERLVADLWNWTESHHLRGTLDGLEQMGLADYVEVDLRIVRGLAYYTGPVFELFDRGVGLRAICGGGRYDGLLATLGGIDVPALGFGMGDVVLAELIKSRSEPPGPPTPLDAFMVAVTPDDVATVLEYAHRLRDLGYAIEYSLAHTPVRRQLELAGVRGARFAIIIGPEEREQGAAVMRELSSRTERPMPFAELVDAQAW